MANAIALKGDRRTLRRQTAALGILLICLKLLVAGIVLQPRVGPGGALLLPLCSPGGLVILTLGGQADDEARPDAPAPTLITDACPLLAGAHALLAPAIPLILPAVASTTPGVRASPVAVRAHPIASKLPRGPPNAS